MQPSNEQDRAKLAAATAAIDAHIQDGMKLGLGSGSTSHWFVRALGEAVKNGLDVVGVPTSTSTRDLALEVGVPLTTLADAGRLNLTVDGADEIDADGVMIKGGGACLLWERIIAETSEKMVCVVDESKVVDQLGAFPLPIEVVQFEWETTRNAIGALLGELGYGDVELTRRMQGDQPLVTDSGNFIVDAHLRAITDPLAIDGKLNWIPGVVENGLFTGIATELIIGRTGGSPEVRDVSESASARPDTRGR